eukprot:CAMPEP_0170534180 /NCGR_PEP_ID=MMETSP0209-20121228/89083_1 /TAXON_ID=665100 ORGANISM="Litonotus pictus, Strain P1" /NCGR_SAMPLE_ID=MMETSP0209 /ASSEMBLY_ACC=CAM_ASM_000301 /LENGTH=238 /DNA_ID=CAMNT_0010833153 /DNA_START=301 /DNA_END=1014 /DNA_ORIENTATION=-
MYNYKYYPNFVMSKDTVTQKTALMFMIDYIPDNNGYFDLVTDILRNPLTVKYYDFNSEYTFYQKETIAGNTFHFTMSRFYNLLHNYQGKGLNFMREKLQLLITVTSMVLDYDQDMKLCVFEKRFKPLSYMVNQTDIVMRNILFLPSDYPNSAKIEMTSLIIDSSYVFFKKMLTKGADIEEKSPDSDLSVLTTFQKVYQDLICYISDIENREVTLLDDESEAELKKILNNALTKSVDLV